MESSKIQKYIFGTSFDLKYGHMAERKEIGHNLLNSITKDINIDCLIVEHIKKTLNPRNFDATIQFNLEELAELRKSLHIPYINLDELREKVDPSIYETVTRIAHFGIINNRTYNNKILELRKNNLEAAVSPQKIND